MTEVDTYLQSVADQRRRADAVLLTDLMAEATGERPVLWGGSIVGRSFQATRARDPE